MILLDTHALLWWLDQPGSLGKKAQKLIGESNQNKSVYVSAISFWEIGMLVTKGRLVLTMPLDNWVNKVVGLEEVEVIDINWKLALTANLIDYPHPDPADRLIISTALEHKLKLITKDKRINSYQKVETIW